jgi:hypothetical protein
MSEYHSLPSYKIVLVLKDCKQLLLQRPEYSDRIKATILHLRNILIERQTI